MTEAADLQPGLHRLVRAARDALTSSRHPAVKVAAAVETANGRIYAGVQVRSHNCGHCATCAEAVAIGAALTAGETELRACVAVVHTKRGAAIWSPCGTCREVLRDLGVTHVVVAERAGQLVTATPDELLPWP